MSARPSKSDSEEVQGVDRASPEENSAIVCPVCGETTMQEKCKVICKSEICRGRVIMNCAEF